MLKTACILLLLSTPALAQTVSPGEAKRRMDSRYGFRDLRFETDTVAVPGLRYVFNDGPVRIYHRPADTLAVGAARLASLSYGFVAGKLSQVTLMTHGLDNTRTLREAFQALYGEGCTVCGPAYLWGSSRERILIIIHPISGDGTFTIYSKPMAKVEEVARRHANQKAATGL